MRIRVTFSELKPDDLVTGYYKVDNYQSLHPQVVKSRPGGKKDWNSLLNYEVERIDTDPKYGEYGP